MAAPPGMSRGIRSLRIDASHIIALTELIPFLSLPLHFFYSHPSWPIKAERRAAHAAVRRERRPQDVLRENVPGPGRRAAAVT